MNLNDLRPISLRILGTVKNGLVMCLREYGAVYWIKIRFSFGRTCRWMDLKIKQDPLKLTPGFRMEPIEGLVHDAVMSSEGTSQDQSV